MRAGVSDLPIVLEAAGVTLAGREALRPMSHTFRPGAPTVLLGPNGSGKTTLLKLAMGLVMPTTGRVTWGGRSDATPERRGFLLQRPVMLRRTVSANVAFALQSAGFARDDTRVEDLLRRVGLAGLGARPARRLSGGEQQRLALARVLARKPDVMFLDEPTASLDPASTTSVEAIIAAAAGEGIKVVMSTHDVGQARRLGGDILLLVNGRVAEAAPAGRFFDQPATPEAQAFLRGDIVL